jgi:hypothetical protein
LLSSVVSSEVAARPAGAEDVGRPLREFLKTVDVGDVARRLGSSVARILGERASRPPPPDPEPAEVTTSKEGGKTQTFAVQDSFGEWTRPLTPAVSGPPAMVAAAVAGAGAVARSGREPPRWVAGVIVGAALLVLFTLWRSFVASPQPPSLASRSAAAIPTAVEPAVATSPAPQPDIAESASTPAAVVAVTTRQAEPTPEPNAQRQRTVESRAEPVAGDERKAVAGALTLSADPTCQVLVDGKARGRTPIRDLSLPAGSYRVEFVSELTNERLDTSVQLVAGAHNRLHADFTAATPRIVVH